MRKTGDAMERAEQQVNDLFARGVDEGRSLVGQALHHPFRTARMLALLRRLPARRVALPPGPAARAVRAALRAHPLSRRSTLGVVAALATAHAPGTFLEGRSRSTLRRRVRSAERRGVVVRPVVESERSELLQLADEYERTNPRDAYRVTRPDNADLLDHDLWLVAEDEAQRPLLLAVIPWSGGWAVLRYFRTLADDPAASDARYLMTAVLAEELAGRGVEFLVDSSRPHWLPNGLRHFQRMAGFRLIRLRGL